MDSQIASKNLHQDDGQLEMPLSRTPRIAQDVDISMIMRQQSMLSAINLCINASGLEDKEIYLAMDIDAGQWSRIRKGASHFPPNRLNQLMELCGNLVPLIWLAHTMGYEIKPLRSSLERQLEEERAARLDAEKRLQTIIEYEQARGRK